MTLSAPPETNLQTMTRRDPVYGERTGPRVVADPITGYPVVTRRPGAPIVTNEDIKRWLEDFP